MKHASLFALSALFLLLGCQATLAADCNEDVDQAAQVSTPERTGGEGADIDWRALSGATRGFEEVPERGRSFGDYSSGDSYRDGGNADSAP